MTSVDKLSRSFDFLKIPTQLYVDVEQRKQDVKLLQKKDKITHLNLIYDNIIAPNVRQAEEWTKMVSFAIEAYLVYFDDDDQDVYFVADECLNKTIKTLLDTNLIRLQYDLYRFIRKNGPERSLKGALIRFAELSHLIKSHKCRMFVELLIKENILSKIAARQEEAIQSILVGSMTKICSSFCWSMTDSEIKMLIQSFMLNLSNEASVNSYRRVSANCLSIICLFSRTPFNFYYYLHEELFRLIMPLEDCKNVFVIWSVLTCFRFMIIHLAELDKCSGESLSQVKSANLLKQSKRSNNSFNLINLCEIYEVCVYFLNSADNRILNSSLECLQMLLKYLPFGFSNFLTQTGSLSSSFVAKLCTTLFTSKKKIPLEHQNSDLGSLSQNSMSLSNSFDSLNTIRQQSSELQQPNTSFKIETHEVNDLISNEDSFLEIFGDLRPVKLATEGIGEFYSEIQAPIDYLIRLLTFKYLLDNSSGSNCKLKSDNQVKVLTKAIAFECATSTLLLSPNMLFYSLFVNDSINDTETEIGGQVDSDSNSPLFIYEIIEYINHTDNKMRSNACLLIGQLINVILVEWNGNFDEWLQKMIETHIRPCKKSKSIAAIRAFNSLKIEVLIDHLMRLIKSESQAETSNMCKRYAVNALHSCLPTMLQTKYASYSLNILVNLIHLRHSTYNLVKCELVDLISSIDFKTANYIESLLPGDKCLLTSFKLNDQTPEDDLDNKAFSVKNTQENLIENVFIYLLGSEDSKLRLETAKSLTRFVINMNFFDIPFNSSSSTSNQKALLSIGESITKLDGYASNTFSSSLIDNDHYNLNALNLAQLLNSNISTASTSTNANCKSFMRQANYSCSPLSALSLFSSLPTLCKSNNVINNNFIQPFHSIIKYWPSTTSVTNSISSNMNAIIEHNLNYIVSLLIKTLLQSVDKHQFIGCLETLDILFQTYSPAIYYTSCTDSICSNINSANYQQLYDLLNLMISYLRHPFVAFDLYASDILMRLIGNLYSSYNWLSMKKLDKLVQQLNYIINSTLNSNTNNSSTPQTSASASALSTIQHLIETLNNSIKTMPYPQSQAEQTTGLTYTYPLVFNNMHLKQSTDKLFVHLMKMLCVLSCVIDESSLPSILTVNLATGSTAINPTNLSPIVTVPSSVVNTPSVSSNLTEQQKGLKFPAKKESLSGVKNKPTAPTPPITTQSDETPTSTATSSLPKTASNVYIGNFQNSSIYLKIYETAKVSFNAYKKSANIGTYDKFLQIIKATLKLFAQLLESGLGVHEVGPHLDEILLYLKIIFSIEPSCSVKVVTLCLKSLFSLNLAGLMSDFIQQQLTAASSFNTNFVSNIADYGMNSVNSMPTPVVLPNTGNNPNSAGLSNALSSSLTSLTSYSNQTLSMVSMQTMTKREKSSILATVVTNQLNQFTRFMYSQALMFKSDNLIGGIIQINPALDMQQLSSQLSSYSSLPITTAATAASISTSSSSSSISTVSKVSSFSTNPFNLFSLIRNKTKSDSMSIQQQQKELEQQKLKQQKTDHKTITQYIKSFESIVIKSLRQYTFTTSVNLQTRILELLTQLIFLKVDYCLLDSDKVFFDYVLKQFDYLEQKRTGENSTLNLNRNKSESSSTLNSFDLNTDDNGANLLAKSYAVDLYENFDSETSITDPLNPFDLDTMLNKLCANLNSPLSTSIGASGSSKPVAGSVTSFNSSSSQFGSPIVSCLNLKQQEHQRNHVLIPKLFDFLILLSHEKNTAAKIQSSSQTQPPQQQQTSPGSGTSPIKAFKSPNGLLTIPEVMQLSEHLIASENSPHTHAIPALRPLVMDLFLNRTYEDTKELDIQQDVLIKSLLRLIQYPQIWPLLTIAVLKYKKDSQTEEKWKKVSRHICDALFDSMRSNLSQFKLRFKEFNGSESRAIRRYSRSYISWIESLKQLFMLLGCLAPQVFRPIDFILLSLFEISRPYLINKSNISSNQINNWLCIIMVHLYLLLSHSNEEQILIRLHHLMPEIINSYDSNHNNNGTNAARNLNNTHLIRPRAHSVASSVGTSTRSTTRSVSPITSSASSSISEPNNYVSSGGEENTGPKLIEDLKRSKSKQNQSKSNYLSYKSSSDFDSDLNQAAVYLAKFLLKILEKCFAHVNSLLKFNAAANFSTNLSASSAGSLLRDYQINSNRDLNHTQHLLSNYLFFLMYIVNVGSFNKISFAISGLISNKSKETESSDQKTEETNDNNNQENLFSSKKRIKQNQTDLSENKKIGSSSSSTSSLTSMNNNSEFNFDACQFTCKINKIVLFKLSKCSPFLASLWQYFLVLCNYQDTEYWSSSIEDINKEKFFSSRLSSPTDLDKLDLIDPNFTANINEFESPNSSNPQSLNHGQLNQLDLKTKIKSRLNYSQKLNNESNSRFDHSLDSDLDKKKLTFPLRGNYIYHSTLNEQLFKYLSIAIYCENIAIRNQFDNTTGLAMLLINSLIELFELASHESIVLDLFSVIHRNAYASSLFINCINSNWSALLSKRKLYLLHSCLKSIEGVHLSASGHLLNLVIDKYFHLPYLSLVRYADHIACQRIEMMLSLSTSELLMQLSEEQINNLNKYFIDFKYSFRHKRLILLLEQLQSSLNDTVTPNDLSLESTTTTEISFSPNMKASTSIDFFLLYVNSSKSLDASNSFNLDKEWYYNIVRSACCYSAVSNSNSKQVDDLNTPLVDNTSLKSKQCALILSNLDYENAMSIFSANDFKLSILKDCILLGAKRTQLTIQKLPSALKQAATSHKLNIQKDFMHPMWLASTNLLFDLLKQFCLILPIPPVNTTQSNLSVYESKLNEISRQYDFDSYIIPITEAINAYLRCIRQYPSLLNQLNLTNKINNLITFILFQLNFVTYISQKKDRILTLHCLNESLLCLFNLLIDSKLLDAFCQRANYSTLVSCIINDYYNLLMVYFYDQVDENLIHTPRLTQEHIDYKNFHNHDLLFSTHTFDILLRLRFIICNHRLTCSSSQMTSSENDSNNALKTMNSLFSISATHRFLQQQSHYFKDKLPFNMRDLIEKIYLNLCRLPVLDRFIRIPDSLWQSSGFRLEYGQFLSTDTSTLPPLEYLRDPIVLKEHLRHILCVGWTSRTQFEYEYVNLLTLLHNLSDESFAQPSADSNEDKHRQEGLPIEEIKERNKCICLVVKGLSSWLVKSTLTPKSGSSLNSLYEQVSRNKVPQFLHSQLGRQYSQVKRIVETFSRNSLYSNLNSISIANNINLLHMLDPIVIDEMQYSRQLLDFTQPQPTADALANLIQTSMNLNERDHHVMFSTNIERTMLVNLAANSDTYFYFTQISLEGYLKFLGLWNRNNLIKQPQLQQQNQQQPQTSTTTAASLAASFTNFVTGNNLVDEVVSNKTATAITANIIKVAEFFAEDTDLLGVQPNNEPQMPLEDSTNPTPSGPPLLQSQLIQRSFNRNNLDLTSVLRTVLDYYESFFRQPCPQLKLDIFKSMIYLGNILFDSKQQYESLVTKLQLNFEWLNSFIQQDYDDQSSILMPTVNELIDDSVLAAGIYAEALCRCCLHTSKNDLQMSSKDFERLNKMFENGFRSSSLPIKIATCQGIFYWLEAISLGFITNNNDAKQITDHVCKQITQMKDVTHIYIALNPRYISSLWAAVFYTIENCLDSIRDAQNFVSLFIKQTYIILNDPSTPYFLFYQLYMGLERFLLSSMIPSFEINSIQRLLTSKFNDENKSLCLTSLTITSLYASNQFKQINYWNDIINQRPASVHLNNLNRENDSTQNSPIQQENPIENVLRDYPQILELSAYPDLQTNLLKVLEVATNFLDRMKASSTAKEASIYASLLPKILCDFLPPHDLLNKLITEFLNSSQHPYPEAVAYVLYKCFDLLQEKGLQSQIQEWCLLSLTNFLQRASIYESIWLSSCLLVSATRNTWLKSTFPFLLNRYCSFETIDRAIFYMSVIEFRKQFTDKAQLQAIYSTFESVTKPNTPYAELIKLISQEE